jgi:hypothetical protein
MLGGSGQSNGIRFYFRLLVRTGGAVMGVGGAVASGIGTDVSFLPGKLVWAAERMTWPTFFTTPVP